MKNYNIPVEITIAGEITVCAKTLESAVKKARKIIDNNSDLKKVESFSFVDHDYEILEDDITTEDDEE